MIVLEKWKYNWRRRRSKPRKMKRQTKFPENSLAFSLDHFIESVSVEAPLVLRATFHDGCEKLYHVINSALEEIYHRHWPNMSGVEEHFQRMKDDPDFFYQFNFNAFRIWWPDMEGFSWDSYWYYGKEVVPPCRKPKPRKRTLW